MTINPDALLLGYYEDLSLLGSARAQRLTLTFGDILEETCTRTKNCQGHPRHEAEGWKCSACRKPWTTEPAELGVNEEGRRSGNRWRESFRYARLADFGRILDQVADEMPWPFLGWTCYLLHPGAGADGLEVDRKRVPTLGVHLEQVPSCLLALEQRGIIHGVPKPLSLYRVKSWVRQARDRTTQLAMRHGV